MNTFQKGALALLVTSANIALCTSAFFSSAFKEMQESMQQMQETFETIEKSFSNMRQIQDGFDISIEEEPNAAVVTIKGLETENLDATINDDADNILIKTGQGNITIATFEEYISVNWQGRKEKEEKNKNDEIQKVLVSSSQQMFEIMTSKPLNLTENKIDYDKSNKLLRVEIPYIKQPEQKRKPLPVNVK
jgi:flagellar hook assembly protein FlgD